MKRIKYLPLVIFILVLAFTGCKKDQEEGEAVEEIVSPTTGTRKQFTLDSIFLYAKQVYLWNDALPTYAVFDPRTKYGNTTSDLTAFNTELFDITQLKINTSTGLPYEYRGVAGVPKYSYLVAGVSSGGQVAGLTDAIAVNPITLTSSITAGTSQVGYIVLSSFPKLAESQSYLDDTFSKLAAASVTDLVVDMRSNGGGYVETAEYIANLIGSSSLNGKKMYSEQFNAQMQNDQALILRHQPYLDANGKSVTYQGRPATMADVDFTEAANTYNFSKKGTLDNLKSVYFIVSGSTASASELLINCLKPYMNVKLAGTKTYGKPVGFFGVVVDKYTVYMSSFLLKNGSGSGDYFNGMAVDLSVVADGAYPLGDVREACLKKVLDDIAAGGNTKTSLVIADRLSTLKTGSSSAAPAVANAETLFIENRLKVKP
ncbi:S41 family peptidase [Pedobacter sp. AW1-32]|uniref:S41 family peptidase n=1 Tax=Pedobacter sp. AW1-32 TaxID=3383026 RepID=UPI003FEE4457